MMIPGRGRVKITLTVRNRIHLFRTSFYLLLCHLPMHPHACHSPLMLSTPFAVMNDPTEHATGIEKRELLAMKAGNENPFDMKVFKRGPGTKDSPNLIPSAFDARLVGCVCE